MFVAGRVWQRKALFRLGLGFYPGRLYCSFADDYEVARLAIIVFRGSVACLCVLYRHRRPQVSKDFFELIA